MCGPVRDSLPVDTRLTSREVSGYQEDGTMALKAAGGEAGTGRLAALRLVTDRTDLQRARPGGRGNRLPAEIRKVDGSRTGTRVHGPHDLPALGNPPAGWPAELRAIWRSLRDEVPWLRKPDRKLVIRYCRLYAVHEAAYERIGDMGADSPFWKAWIETGRELFKYEQRMGMTPADRSRIVGGFDR